MSSNIWVQSVLKALLKKKTPISLKSSENNMKMNIQSKSGGLPLLSGTSEPPL